MGYRNEIQYITIASLGNATDFGDLTESRGYMPSVTNGTNGVCCGGSKGATVSDVLDHWVMDTLGNATDFGDMLSGKKNNTGASGSAS